MTKPLLAGCLAAAILFSYNMPLEAAIIDDAADLFTQQQQEKNELEEMKQEMQSLKGDMTEALQGMQQLSSTAKRENAKEFRLQAKEGSWELMPGTTVNTIMYNGRLPGPVIRIPEGELVKITFHNQLKQPSSLYFDGMNLPQQVNGLPRKGAGLVMPGESYVYQFVAKEPGTYWYHPQVMHADQTFKGLAGVLVVEPKNSPKTYERDLVLVMSQAKAESSATGASSSKAIYLVNGKSAPAIPPIDLKRGEHIRIRLLNASRENCPIYMTGHKFEIVANSGSESIEPHTNRDLINIGPGERYDLEFVANNPGVWTLTSLLPEQCSNGGKFPGGIAVVVRYEELIKN